MMTPAEMMARRAVDVRKAAGNAGSVISPCISVCRMDDATGWCEGCFRTLDEIAFWSRCDDVAKLAVWAAIEERAVGQIQATPEVK